MHRILILCLLAIGISVFAVDSSRVILQAKKIRETSIVLSWTPIENAERYKVFYDELNLIDLASPTPLLATEYITTEEVEIPSLTSWTEYYFVVHGYDRDGNDVGTKSLPLHARTFRAITMDIAKDAYVRDQKTIVLTFTRPIDAAQADIAVKNTETQKMRTIWSITTDPADTRIVYVNLKWTLEPGITHEVNMKKIVSLTAGIELPAEKRIPMNIAWTEQPVVSETSPALPGNLTPEPSAPFAGTVASVTSDVIDPSSTTDSASSEVLNQIPDSIEASKQPRIIDEPVPIDKLPQTGPAAIIFFFIGLLGVFIGKKSSRRIES